MEFSNILGKTTDFNKNPFRPWEMLTLKDKFMLSRFITEFKSNLTDLQCRFIADYLEWMDNFGKNNVAIPPLKLHVSEVTMGSSSNGHETLLDAIDDPRCVTFGKNLKRRSESYQQRNPIFLTP